MCAREKEGERMRVRTTRIYTLARNQVCVPDQNGKPEEDDG